MNKKRLCVLVRIMFLLRRAAYLRAALALLNLTAAYSTPPSSPSLCLWCPAGLMLEYTGSVWLVEKWTLA